MNQSFELLTAEYLFDPQGQGELFTKDDDHMAQIIELLGDFPLEAKMGGKYSRELFDHAGLSSFPALMFLFTNRNDIRKPAVHQDAEALATEARHDGEVPVQRGRRRCLGCLP